MTPKIIYFDLGNVLLTFSHQRMCRQIADVFQTNQQRVWDMIFEEDDPLGNQLETGKLSSKGFYDRLCDRFDAQPEYEAFADAASNIFEVNVPMLPVLCHVAWSGKRLGLLSNIHQLHWDWILRRGYAMIPGVFDVLALSYEIGAMKPSGEIFQAAAELAGVAPEEIFFVDDIAGHVSGASSAGYDAVQFVSAPDLVRELQARDIVLNY
ncbi:MAG: HAD family phosphatase [Planctomycetales bacterium]